mmetsp:Transcript_37780/g.117803  ORF Transcript_37780/g.117803 Transcript_37780/m.117803 type:complete len:210 (-) Transcript_37780:753-1382(-)
MSTIDVQQVEDELASRTRKALGSGVACSLSGGLAAPDRSSSSGLSVKGCLWWGRGFHLLAGSKSRPKKLAACESPASCCPGATVLGWFAMWPTLPDFRYKRNFFFVSMPCKTSSGPLPAPTRKIYLQPSCLKTLCTCVRGASGTIFMTVVSVNGRTSSKPTEALGPSRSVRSSSSRSAVRGMKPTKWLPLTTGKPRKSQFSRMARSSAT